MKYTALIALLLTSISFSGEIEVGESQFESLNPFCH